jgi:hypothetical protein
MRSRFIVSTSRLGDLLTDPQRDLLRSAVCEGYFEIPREITLVDLAERHGLSDREASEEIRRGLDVLGSTITNEANHAVADHTPVDSMPDALTSSDSFDALRRAMEMGYFEVPREATLTDVAERLGRSDVTVSKELRQGMAALLRWTNVVEPTPVRTDGATDRSLNRSFTILAHPYRRRILLLVGQHNPRDEREFSVDDLATDDDDLELLTTELYHIHLPKLVDAGYIDWDEETSTIRRGPNFDEIAPLLRLMT